VHDIPIDVHPVTLRRGDLLLTDPDDPDRDVAWRVTRDAYPEPVTVDVKAAAGRLALTFIVDYVTDGGVEGTHAFFPPVRLVRVLPAPLTPADRQPTGTAEAVA
jgi:hypothetical protein